MTHAPNVFLLNASAGPEDRFTAHWTYLLHCHPELGQRVLDRIAEWTDLPQSEYVDSIDHPWYTIENRPDFAIRSHDYDVLCEHKLDAQLGPSQLERYCALARSSGTPAHVVLIGKSPINISQDVLTLPQYRAPVRRPQHTEARDHFLWEDFYDLVGDVPTRLARDFAAYMSQLGLEPWKWSALGDPFTDDSAKAQFRRLWREVLPGLRRPGSLVKQDRVNMGFQYQRPMRGVHLIYVGIRRVIEPPTDPRVPGRAIVARIWQSEKQVSDRKFLLQGTGAEREVAGVPSGIEIFRRYPGQTGAAGVLTREYYSPLALLMRETTSDCVATIRLWLDIVLHDVERDSLAFDSC